ncbi:M1 family aminopeptidase [Modestobacter excelsi]|uniref:M1 family aminopeptidase n=1 Tax=Modestobacter excelsi TaxID=2213161 RepID=UPI00110C9211|nr:M1 family aminopeptidase [Modestobacter excelsi]
MRRAPVVLAALLLTAGCGATGPEAFPAPTSAAPDTGAGSCPGERAAPDPDRPAVDLAFRLDDDLRTVTGTETVAFTPDLPTGELVFRLVPNGPDATALGNQLTVTGVRGADVAGSGYESAAAAAPGGLYVVTLADRLAAGESTEVALDFTLRLGGGGFERLGTAAGVSWWASGAPLLAWEPGVGWARDPFVALLGETASSPVSDTTISVDAPAALTVLMTGDQDEPTRERGGRRTWTSHEPVARDVSVAAGSFVTAETEVAGVRVTTGVLPGSGRDPARLARATGQAIEQLAARFGAFPYATLTVPWLPDFGGGIEYPSSILLASEDETVLVHEVAHMWFYGMVGDSQFRDPWLDEAFASYAESVTGDPPPARVSRLLATDGDVGGSMASFPDDRRYVTAVYGKGAAALLTARQQAGAEAFDAALRCYVDARAWTIATPADVGTALADLPAALAVLQQAGALDPEDLPR